VRTRWLLLLPLLTARLAQAAEAPGDPTLFGGLWGWMQTLCFWLLDLLRWLAGLTGNWGLAIVLVAVLVRLFAYPFARRALLAQKRFNEVQKQIAPELAAIKRDYKGGEQSERIIALYAEHQVSPLAGMKPLLIVLLQLPVFVALFQILEQAPELHGARFLWIGDLSGPDRIAGLGLHLPWFGDALNLLPFLLAASIMLAALTIPGDRDAPGHKKRLLISGLMALSFFVGFYSFPAGLVLYWVVTNLLQVAQQWLVSARTRATA
jgi:YidC/Oxa1 family membrane protein insertase